MLPDNLIFVNAVPSDDYFRWQVEVMTFNFLSKGIKNIHTVVWYRNEDELPKWYELQKKYPQAQFFFYKDSGADVSTYIPVLRPHVLAKHFEAQADLLKDKAIFYHDSDIIFNYLPDFNLLLQDDICWESDTSSYLDYTYLTTKEKQGSLPEHFAVSKLAEIGGITVDKIKEYDKKTGGAQTLLKGIDADLWKDVEENAIKIMKAFHYRFEDSINRTYFKNENEGFQSWAMGDMIGLNLALWKRGIKTDITKELDFSWATDNYETFKRKPLFHLAGITGPGINTFFKGEWINKSPIGVDLPLPPEDTAVRQYVNTIKQIT